MKDQMNAYEQKQAARKARFEQRALAANTESQRTYEHAKSRQRFSSPILLLCQGKQEG